MEFVSYTKRRSVGVRRGALAGKCRLLAFGVSALGEPPILLSILLGKRMIFASNGGFFASNSYFSATQTCFQSYWLDKTVSQAN